MTYATKVTKIQNEPVKNDDPKMKMINNLKIENNSLLEKLNAANERILHLTQKMKKGGAELTGGDETNREEKIEIKKPSKVNVSNGNDDLVLTDFEHHADSRMLDINNQSNAEDKYITEELVEAINQIRYLLGSLKQEREKNEFLSIQNEKQETLVSQVILKSCYNSLVDERKSRTER